MKLPLIRRLLHGGERGQALILMTLVTTIILVIGVIITDFGLVLSERNHLRIVADAAALAGAGKLTLGSSCPSATVTTAATDYAAKNGDSTGVTANCPPTSGPHTCANDPSNCNNYVEVKIQHDVGLEFGSIFGLGNITATGRSVATQVQSLTAYAFYSHGSNCVGGASASDIDWSGSGVTVTGATRSNGKLSGSGGSGNTFNGPVTYGNGAGCTSSWGNNNTYTNPPPPNNPAPSAFVDWPPFASQFFSQWANFWNNPAGAGCTKIFTTGNVSFNHIGDASQGQGDGVYCSTNGDLTVSHCDAAAHVTLVAKGNVNVSGCSFGLTAYGSDPNGLLIFTGCPTSPWLNCSQPSINVSFSGSRWSGLILAQYGEVQVSGSGNASTGLNGGVYGETIHVSGSNWSMTGTVPATAQVVKTQLVE